MEPAKHSRYAGGSRRKAAAEPTTTRRGTSTTLNQSADGRRLVAKTRAVELTAKKPIPNAPPPSALLDSTLNRVTLARRTSDGTRSFGTDFANLDYDFYDTNTGGFDDDYVDTNVDLEGQDGLPESALAETVCGIDERGVVVHLTDDDARKARYFASVRMLYWPLSINLFFTSHRIGQPPFNVASVSSRVSGRVFEIRGARVLEQECALPILCVR